MALWQGATPPRARARKAEQRRQEGATALRHQVRSAFTYKVMGLVCEILSIHKVLPKEVSAQLRFFRVISGAPQGVANINAVNTKSMPRTDNEAITTVRVVACATPSGVACDSYPW